MENQNSHYEKELKAVNKATGSIVELLMRCGVRERREAGEKPLWDSRIKLWERALSAIQKIDGTMPAKYEGSTRQNVALLDYIKTKILNREMLDPKTLDFVPVGVVKARAVEARREVQKEVQQITIGRGQSVLKYEGAAAIPTPIAPAQVEPEPRDKQYENDQNVIREISGALDMFLTQNRNRPYDTSADGADGGARRKFRQTGEVKVLDNISGKVHTVCRDPSRASRVVDGFGNEKLLTGTPALCDDVVTEFLNQNGIRIPAERSVAILEKHFKKHPRTYTMFHQGVAFPGYGNDIKLSIPCQPGDIITSSRGGGRHIFLVTRVDSKGTPVEVLDSSAMNQGVGKRPFLGKNPAEDLTSPDFRGHARSRAVVGPGIIVNYVIRPRYSISLQNLAKAEPQLPEG